MLLQAPNYNRYMFRRELRRGLTEWFFFVNGFKYVMWRTAKGQPELTEAEARKLADNLWKEIFGGDGEQYV